MATLRHAWQRPRPLRHASQRPRHALQRSRHALQRPRPPRHAFLQRPRSPTSKKKPSHLLPYKLWSQGSSVPPSFIYMEVWWYITPLVSQLIRQQVGGFFLRCGTPRTLRKGMPRRPRTLQSMPRTLRSMPRRLRTLPSMPRSCQASLYILGSHRYNREKKIINLWIFLNIKTFYYILHYVINCIRLHYMRVY